MDVKQFCSLQIFELVYLLVLAFLPFVVAVREVTIAILTVLAIGTAVVVIRYLLLRRVDPEGRVVFISGCDSGFGNACARRLDLHGYTVIAGCLNAGSEGAALLQASTTGRMHVVSLDVTDEDSVFQCMAKVKEFCQNKGLWAIINNAGIASFGDIEFTSMEKYRQVLEVNLLGSIQLTKLCLPYVRKAKGRVINMSGASGLLSAPGQSAFCISCFAVEAFSDALRIEMQPFGVKVITIRPGNYLGATGILNKSACGKVKTEFDQLKNSTDQEVLNAYGTKHLDTQLEQLSDLSKSTASSLVNVVTAMENAVTNLSSGSQYLVDGGSQLFDVSNILIKLRPFVPASWHDSLVSKNFRQGTTVQAVQ